MARALRRPDLALALAALVGLSTLLHWLAARRFTGLWIMPDEAIYARRAVDLYQHASLPLFGREGAGYGVLYPVVSGLPLSIGSFPTGDALLKPVQALVISLAAVPVYFYGRRLADERYALIAAALTLASPLLLYSGLVMTEVAFYPVAALTLLSISRAVATAERRHQIVALALIGVAILTRTQAVVFVGVLAGGAVLDALLRRDVRRLRSFWPTGVVTLALLVVAVAAPGTLGAYSATVRGSYPLGSSLGLTYDHLAYLAVSVAVLPVATFALLSVDAVRGRERDPQVRALLVVTAVASVLVCAQVGFFAARYAPHLLGRDLIALPPLYFLLFAVWLARGEPRRLGTAAAAAFGVLALVVLAPWDRLSAGQALPDSFDLAALERLRSVALPATVVTVVGLVLLVLFVLTPSRVLLVLPLLVLGLLTASSVVASNTVSSLIRTDQLALVGPMPTWIDRAADGDVTYLYDGEEVNILWQQQFWNHRLTRVLSALPYRVPGAPPEAGALLTPSGALPIETRYVAASNMHQFVGTRIAHVDLPGSTAGGLTLWRLDGPPTLSLLTTFVLPNGDISQPAAIDAFACAGGQLRLTLIPKKTTRLRILLDGRNVADRNIAGLSSVQETVDVPSSHASRVCHFTIVPQQLLGSTQIEFARP